MNRLHTRPVCEPLRRLAAAEPGLSEALARADSVDAALQCLADASERTGIGLDLDAAHELLAQAEAQREAAAEPLSDEALTEMAGGTLKPGVIVWSVLTLGLSCALASYHARNSGYSCEDSFHGRTPRPYPIGD